MKLNITQTIKILILALILAVGAQYALADWTPAPAGAPANNVDAPVNVSTYLQKKLGALWVNTSSSDPNVVGFVSFGQSVFNGPVKIIDGTQGANKVLTSDADGLASWAPSGGTHGYTVLSGSGSYTVPAGVTSIEVHVVGGGASGERYGGMGGGYATSIMSVTPGQVIAYAVGAGGTATCNVGASGASSTFGSITAYGGLGSLSDDDAVTTYPLGITAGGYAGSNWGAYGHSWLDAGYTNGNGDKTPGYPSGFPYSRGGGAKTNTPQASTGVNPTYGGGGNGDNDATGGYCGSVGAAGTIIVKY